MAALILALLEKHDSSQQVQACLVECGYEVIAVDTFVKAKDLLKSKRPDLIVSDVHLENGGSVFDFLRWAKKGERACEIPFVLLSSQPSPMAKYLADGLRMSARILGAATYIQMETFDAAAFQEHINDLLPPDKRTADLHSPT